jgi:predicted lactoylglutathione lyase
MIFVNLPVEDVTASRAFYTGLGFTVNEQFSDDQVTAVVVSDQIVVMLLERPRFEEFLQGTRIADAHRTTEVLNALSAASREEVDRFVERAVAHGGKARRPYTEGGMYGQSVTDPDGHVWEVFVMEAEGAG